MHNICVFDPDVYLTFIMNTLKYVNEDDARREESSSFHKRPLVLKRGTSANKHTQMSGYPMELCVNKKV